VWIILCAKEKCCGPRTSICASDEDDAPVECTREKDWYEIRVVTNPPECVCSCLLDDEAAEVGNEGSGEGDTAEGESSGAANNKVDCKCATGPCYEDHYEGLCKCHCGDCSDCDCKCVLLAVAEPVPDEDEWKVDHSVRRFVRPVLMRDPQVAREKKQAASGAAGGAAEGSGSGAGAGKKASSKAQGRRVQRLDTEILEDEGSVSTTKRVRLRKTGLNRPS
jgi:hypothetical protein